MNLEKTMSETNYEFRRRLAIVHQPDRRDPAVQPTSNDTLVEDGWRIVIPYGASEALVTTAHDLQHYFFTSMEVSVLLQWEHEIAAAAENSQRCILLATKAELPALGVGLTTRRSYRLLVSPQHIVICGHEDHGAAQGSYYLEEQMNLRAGPLVEQQDLMREPLFSPRMVHSGWGLDQFPDEYLNLMAHYSFDAALLFVGDPFGVAPHLDRTPKGYRDFNELIDRAERYGIDVYAYSYLKSHKHPDDPDAEAYYERSYGALFQHCPRFKGVTLVGESVEFPSRDPNTTGRLRLDPSSDGVPPSKPSPGWWPCHDYPQWLNLLKKVVRRYSPEADIVFWTYNWGYVAEEPRLALLRALPTDVTLLVTFEMFEQVQREGVTNVCVDYTLAFEGPGHYFASEAKVAHERGIRLYTMCNTGGQTWDFGVIPYQPAPFQWGRRYDALRKAQQEWGLSGLMESHHYGWWPSFVAELAKNAYWSGSQPIEEAAAAIARRDYGETAAPLVMSAWQEWSEAMRDYVPTNEDQYGPFRIGPAYPMFLRSVTHPPAVWHAMFGHEIIQSDYAPHEDPRQSLGAARFPVEIRTLEKMAARWRHGLQQLKEALGITPDLQAGGSARQARQQARLEELINLGQFILHSVYTTIHLKQWWLLKQELATEPDPAKASTILDRMVTLAEEEIANAQATIPLVEKDSRLGYEPSMEYMCDRAHLEWKIAVVRRVITHEIPRQYQSLNLTQPTQVNAG
jgi:hypothetical protein